MAESDLNAVQSIAAAGLRAQTLRMKVVAENIANASTTPTTPDETPYQRRIVTFKNEFDRAEGVYKVRVNGIRKDRAPFIRKFEPSHPAADANGFINTPNVQPVLEGMDMREAQRSYEANLGVIEASRSMILRTIDILR